MYNFLKFIFLLPLLLLPLQSNAKNESATYLIGAFNEPEGERSGLELSVSGKGDYLGGRFSLSLYSGGNNTTTTYEQTVNVNGGYPYYENTIIDVYESNETYAGISGFAFIHINQPINPYLGVGLFLGKTQSCTSYEEQYEDCLEDPILAIYPELGVEFNILRVQITPYIRRYFDTSDSRKSGNIYGINVGLNF